MIQGKRVLAIIPARGGSKGIKNKNIIPLGGKPLISYTIEAAINCDFCDKVIVSTDSEEIAEVAQQFGAEVPFLRPKYLASDESKIIDAVLYSIEKLRNDGFEYDILLLLQPTQPLRSKESIMNALNYFLDKKCESLLSVCLVKEHPILIRSISKEGRAINLLDVNSTVRRQDFSEFYKVNGAIYINDISVLNEETSFNDNEYCFVMSEKESVDIDSIDDLKYAKFLMGN